MTAKYSTVVVLVSAGVACVFSFVWILANSIQAEGLSDIFSLLFHSGFWFFYFKTFLWFFANNLGVGALLTLLYKRA